MTTHIRPLRRLRSTIWRWRLRQALAISGIRREPDVVAALHKALREHTPAYLDEWRATMEEVGDVVEDMVDLMEERRSVQDYETADKIRSLAGRLSRSIPSHYETHRHARHPRPIRRRARTYK